MITQKLFILSFNSYKRLGYLHRQLELIYTDMNLAFIPYNTCYFHYRQIFFAILEVSDKVTDKVSDILHRHLHRQNSINLLRSQTNCKLITLPKLSQKKEEGNHRKKQVYTLLYKDNTSTVLNIQSKC